VEIVELRQTLEWVQKKVARLTEVNEGLVATNLSLSSSQDHRYSQLQAEHANAQQQWQQSTRELDDLRQQHVQLSTGMEDIVRHEISIALEDKNAELRRLCDELEVAKEQIRALQQQILASKPSDDLLISRDEDYFDSQCQLLCQHVQQWVLRFSKFSDMKACRFASEVADEKITDRFDNAILDGSDVDSCLADRVRGGTSSCLWS
jgi:DNA repair exonuclease SbcCD ATPase subunit